MHESLHWSCHCCPTKLECGGILNLDTVDIFTVDISRAFWVDFLKKRSYLHLAQCLCSASRGTNSNTVATNGFCLLSTSSNALNEPSLSGPALTPASHLSSSVLAAGWRAIPEERPRFPSVGPDQTSAASGAAALRVFLPQRELSVRGARHAPARGTAGKCCDITCQMWRSSISC